MDNLKELIDKQYELNARTFETHELVEWSKICEAGKRCQAGTATEEDRELVGTWIQRMALAMKQEIAEMIDSTNWKWWRTKVDKFDYQNLKVEVIDILHFWLSSAMILGMDAEDIMRVYRSKNQVNHNRQDEGYIAKDETDCSHIE